MNSYKKIVILGGSGFVGTHLCNALHRHGYTTKVLTRRISTCRSLAVLPSVEIVVNNRFDQTALRELFRGSDVVINLIGILNERGHSGKGFYYAHTEIAQNVLRASQEAGVRRLLHMSALNANPDAPSYYLRSKGQAENYLLTFAGSRTDVTLFCPSVIFGPGDSFINRFASLLKISPVLPLACPEARFAPVFVGDVVNCMLNSIHDSNTFHKKIECCGPRIYTLRQIVEWVAKLLTLRRLIIGLPLWASRLQASLLEYVPGKPFSLDNFRSLQVDSICQHGTPCSTSIESVVPSYVKGSPDNRHS